MAHGGIRYLENGEFRLVNEALHERNRMLRNAPHYVKPLPTTIPIFKRFSGFLNALSGLDDRRPDFRALPIVGMAMIGREIRRGTARFPDAAKAARRCAGAGTSPCFGRRSGPNLPAHEGQPATVAGTTVDANALLPAQRTGAQPSC